MSSLGEVVMLSHVRIHTSSSLSSSDTADTTADITERQERLLMLFADVLLVLSVTSRVSGYIYKVSSSSGSISSSMVEIDRGRVVGVRPPPEKR